MNIQFSVKFNIGNTITVPNQLEVRNQTYLTADEVAGSVTLDVTNTDGFLSPNIMLVGNLTQANAEFRSYSATSTNTITSAALQFSHNRGELIQNVTYDQVDIETAPAETGPFILFGTFLLQPTQETTIIQHTAGTLSTFYRIRFRNSILAVTSDYSPVVSPSTLDPRSCGYMFEELKTLTGVSENDTAITTDFLLKALNEGREYFDNLTHGYHWDWREHFEFPIKLLAGTNFVTLPSNIDFTDTNRSVLAIRYPRDNFLNSFLLIPVDKREWNTQAYQAKGSVTVGATLSGAVTLQLANNGDFFATGGGGAFVATDAFTQTIMQIAYTGVDQTLNTLTGVTGITRNIPAGTQVFVLGPNNVPYYYTVWDDRIVFDRIIPDSLQGTNVYVDYYERLIPMTNINDVMPERYRDIYKPYMRYKIKKRRDPSTPIDDTDYVEFTNQVTSVVNGMYSGQTLRIVI